MTDNHHDPKVMTSLPDNDQGALSFLRKRRSVPPAMFGPGGPSDEQLHDLLRIAARVPDHGKLEPWRFVILRDGALDRIATLVEAESVRKGNPPEKAVKHGNAFRVSVVVAVVSAPKPSDKVPEWEQFLSAGAVCLGLVNAALASGFAACWLSGMAAYPEFAQTHLGISAPERIAGFVHLGGEAKSSPPERPRPDIRALISVLE